MHVDIRWGNLSVDSLSEQFDVDKIIEKNLLKLTRLIQKYTTEVRLLINFRYDDHKKTYFVSVHMQTPKSNFHIVEHHFTFEGVFKSAIHELRRKYRKSKEKKLTLKRKAIDKIEFLNLAV